MGRPYRIRLNVPSLSIELGGIGSGLLAIGGSTRPDSRGFRGIGRVGGGGQGCLTISVPRNSTDRGEFTGVAGSGCTGVEYNQDGSLTHFANLKFFIEQLDRRFRIGAGIQVDYNDGPDEGFWGGAILVGVRYSPQAVVTAPYARILLGADILLGGFGREHDGLVYLGLGLYVSGEFTLF